ncbi:MAG TPA: phosphatase PAP2 family protein [Candidatus Thermoplasmatota archaeon]|nr:phosphatase PAP2 family protein [Candidatus Thermoplasmatota archaeon]
MNRDEWLRTGLWGGLILFAAITVDQVLEGPILQADFPVDDVMTSLAAKGWPIHPIGVFLSTPGSSLVDAPALVLATVALWAWGQRRLATVCLASGALNGFLNSVVKELVHRPLPPHIFDRWPDSYAYPSGHTMGATGTVGIAILLLAEGWIRRQRMDAVATQRIRRRAVAAWLTMSAVVGVARVLAQHHWVSDILGAWPFSIALVCGTLLLPWAKDPEPVQRIPLPPLEKERRRRLAWLALAGFLLFAAVTADTVWHGPLRTHVQGSNDGFAWLQEEGYPLRSVGIWLSQLGSPAMAIFGTVLGAAACLLLGSPRRAIVLVVASLVGAAIITELQHDLTRYNAATTAPDLQHVAPFRVGNQTFEYEVVYTDAHGTVHRDPFPGEKGFNLSRTHFVGFRHMFPSGHTFGATLTFGLAFLLATDAWIETSAIQPWRATTLRRRAIQLWVLVALLGGLGRLLLRVHWYTDVLAGASLAAALVALALLATQRPWRTRGRSQRT